MDRLRKKEEEVIALRTTMKFSSVVFKAKAHREHDEADRKQAVLQKELTEKSKALHARDTLLEKKDMMVRVCLQLNAYLAFLSLSVAKVCLAIGDGGKG